MRKITKITWQLEDCVVLFVWEFKSLFFLLFGGSELRILFFLDILIICECACLGLKASTKVFISRSREGIHNLQIFDYLDGLASVIFDYRTHIFVLLDWPHWRNFPANNCTIKDKIKCEYKTTPLGEMNSIPLFNTANNPVLITHSSVCLSKEESRSQCVRNFKTRNSLTRRRGTHIVNKMKN